MTSQSRIPLRYRGAFLLASADLPAIRKLCGFKGHSAHRAVQNASSISHEPSVRKQTTLVLTETHGLHAIIAVIVYMQRWCEKLQPKVSMKH